MAGETKTHGGQGHHARGQGHSNGHGHEHRRGRQERATAKQKTPEPQKPAESETEPKPETTQHKGNLALTDGDVAVFENGDERVLLTQEVEDGEEEEERGRGERMEEGGDEEEGEGLDTKNSYMDGMSERSDSIGDWNDNAGRDEDKTSQRKARDDFSVKSFNDSLDKFVGILSDPRSVIHPHTRVLFSSSDDPMEF